MKLDENQYREHVRSAFAENGFNRKSALRFVEFTEKRINETLGSGGMQMSELMSEGVLRILNDDEARSQLPRQFSLPVVAQIMGRLWRDEFTGPAQRVIEIQREVAMEMPDGPLPIEKLKERVDYTLDIRSLTNEELLARFHTLMNGGYKNFELMPYQELASIAEIQALDPDASLSFLSDVYHELLRRMG